MQRLYLTVHSRLFLQIVIIAFVNPLSGAQKGCELLPLLQKELGEANVFDIVKEKGPYAPLERYVHHLKMCVFAFVYLSCFVFLINTYFSF